MVPQALLLTKREYRYEPVGANPRQRVTSLAKAYKKTYTAFRRLTLGAIPHIGAGIVASELQSLGYHVTFEDLYDPHAFDQAKDFDLVGISFLDISFDYVARQLPTLDLGKTVFGGQGATSMEDMLREKSGNISIVRGEAEGLMARVVADIAKKQLAPTYQRESLVDFSGLTGEEPHFDERFSFRNHPIFRDSWLQAIEVGRGCNNACKFCSTGSRGLTYKPLSIVEKEISQARKRPGKAIFFIDQNLLAYPKDYLHELLSIINHKGMPWVGEGTINDVIGDTSLIEKMAKHCIAFLVGAEDFYNPIKGAPSKIGLHQGFKEKAAYLREMRVPVVYSLIFGSDEQKPEIFAATADYVNSLGIATISHIATPRSGTYWNQRLEEEGRIIDTNYGHRDQRFHAVHSPKNMTANQLLNGFWLYHEKVFAPEKIFQRFHSNLVDCGSRYALCMAGPELDALLVKHNLRKNAAILESHIQSA